MYSVQDKNKSSLSEQLVGFSSRVEDPMFFKYVEHPRKWATILALVLGAAAVGGFYAAGEVGTIGLKNPQSLFVGLVVGAMFVSIALFHSLGRGGPETWDGSVQKKTVVVKRQLRYAGIFDLKTVEYQEYKIEILRDDGKRYIRKSRNGFDFEYYQIGDRVRYHRKLGSLEKYDKSKDSIIPCNACGMINKISRENCGACGCPLLK